MGELVLNSLLICKCSYSDIKEGNYLFLLLIADCTENQYMYSTIITFSQGDFNKNQIQVVLRNWFLGYLFPERDITR